MAVQKKTTTKKNTVEKPQFWIGICISQRNDYKIGTEDEIQKWMYDKSYETEEVICYKLLEDYQYYALYDTKVIFEICK